MRLLLLPFVALSVSAVAQQYDPTPAVPPARPPANPAPTETNLTGAAQSGNKPIALRIVGSNVKNLKGEYLGRVDDVALNPESKQIEFALLDMDYPTNTTMVTPVPWQLLSYVWDQGQVGGTPGTVQLFRLNVDKTRLAQAPKIDRKQIADLLQPQFREQLLAFFGGTSEAAGATGSVAGETTGGASGGATLAASTTTAGTEAGATTPGYGYAYGTPGFIFTPGNTNIGITNIIDTNRVLFVTNTIVTNTIITNVVRHTNGFFGRTNFARGTNHNFVGGTNFAQGGSNMAPNPMPGSGGETNNVLSPTGRTNVTFTPGTQQQQNQNQTTVPSTATPVQPGPTAPWGVPPGIPPAPAPPANGAPGQPSSSTPDILPPATPSRPGSIFQPPNPAPAPPPAPQRPIR